MCSWYTHMCNPRHRSVCSGDSQFIVPSYVMVTSIPNVHQKSRQCGTRCRSGQMQQHVWSHMCGHIHPLLRFLSPCPSLQLICFFGGLINSLLSGNNIVYLPWVESHLSPTLINHEENCFRRVKDFTWAVWKSFVSILKRSVGGF